MATTVIGTIENPKIAQKLINELVKCRPQAAGRRGARGHARRRSWPRSSSVASTRTTPAATRKAARGGKTLVVAQAPDQKIDQAVAIIERHETAGGEASKEQGETVQEVEEELSVGKRKAATGGVRVTTSVSETPVEETVTLREEKVEAERKPADRKLSPEEAEAAFQGKTVEVLATSEEAEVSKQARVVGEVAVGKQVEEREETVKDTVRRTEVEVEEVGAKARKSR